MRQPIVLTKEEKDNIDENYPGAYDDFLQYGTTKKHKDSFYYICPKIWCPKSKIALNYETTFVRIGSSIFGSRS